MATPPIKVAAAAGRHPCAGHSAQLGSEARVSSLCWGIHFLLTVTYVRFRHQLKETPGQRLPVAVYTLGSALAGGGHSTGSPGRQYFHRHNKKGCFPDSSSEDSPSPSRLTVKYN